ncbi:YopX family protein [Enterococcus faecalis]|uniref:YopX family protein n=2 Tax=Enterococcus faecalis TaxID=1351 RepID=UPI0021B10FC8|nr:YopX family protein [Enterococcus faecalis]WHK13795.1 YopX family protein [Enterococcus faecalis]
MKKMIPKFRAYSVEENVMYYPDEDKNVEWTIDDDTGFIAPLINLGNGMWGMIDKYVLMQSTGLKDKNGVEIFEGDILVYDAPKKYAHRRSMHEIAYADGRFFWEFLDLVFCQSNILYRDGYLVIGNIHENPELLEGN